MQLKDGAIFKEGFTKGVLLAWIPFLFFMFPIIHSVFQSIVHNGATGIGAVAGGISEGLVTVGLATILLSQAAASAYLVRAFSKERLARNIVTALSIGCSLMMIALMGFVIWMVMMHRG